MPHVRCSIEIPSANARAALCEALGGAGGPGGLTTVGDDGSRVTFVLDEARTSLVLAIALAQVELAPFGIAARIATHDPLAPETLAAVAAWGLGDPELRDERTIERALDEAMR